MSRAAHFVTGAGMGHPDVVRGANAYRASQGMAPVSPQRSFANVAVDPVVSRHIAGLYEAAQSNDPAAHASFGAMREDTMRQFDHMTAPTHRGGMGMNVDVTQHDPYTPQGTPEDPNGFHAMARDVTQNKHISVLDTGATGGHPYFSNDENNAFRAVHDTFGHVGSGRDFDRNGEEAAWRSHSSMFSPAARPAMTAETRGQNSTLVFGSNPGQFPEQKIVTLGASAQAIGRRSMGHILGRQFTPPAGLHVP
jgi:hypothetical protein